MVLTPGQRLGPYEVVSAIGAGGMGEVYRGTDTRLGREVAIKVLPEALASDPLFRERFEREARSISALNHPNICTLYDIGHQDDFEFLVMEHLDGETLAERLEKGALSAPEALKIAIETAGALDKAHHQGIVHRDLKPGNVFLTKAGAKLLDFGLAKAGTHGALSDVAHTTFAPSPQPLAPNPALTAQGAILGTFQYMAPEQIEGLEADPRTDIFALGVVLFEMLSGTKAFTGRSQASLMGAILKDQPPPLSQVQPDTPPALDHLVQTCLAKDPDERWQTAGDLLRELKWIAAAHPASGSEGVAGPALSRAQRGSRHRREWLAWAAAAAFFIVATGLAVALYRTKPPADVRVRELSILLPPDARLASWALSPDGHYLALAATVQGRRALWLRPIDSAEAHQLPGTDGASRPFWSPDSRSIGFFAQKKLKRIQVSGGPPQTVCGAPFGYGGAWSPDGTIVFSPDQKSVLFRVAAGGTPAPATKFDVAGGETDHRYPHFLPDGRHFLYYSLRTGTPRVDIGSLDFKAGRPLIDADSAAAYVAGTRGSGHGGTGYVLFLREGSLLVQPFDDVRLETVGDAAPIRANVAGFAASNDGTLVLRSGGSEAELVWFDRAGKRLGTVGPPGQYGHVELAPDGRRVAVDFTTPPKSGSDIWLLDSDAGLPAQFTSRPELVGSCARWSSDGTKVVFDGCIEKNCGLIQKRSDGTGASEVLFPRASDARMYPGDWSRDGRHVVFRRFSPGSAGSLWMLPLAGDRQPTPVPQTEARGTNGRFSPDGRWLAYTTDESGRYEVYVQSFPPSGTKWPVSRDGGTRPRWRDDGRELFYLDGAGRLMAVPVEPGPTFRTGAARPLMDVPFELDPVNAYQYAVAPGGQRFLVITPTNVAALAPLTVVLNWMAGLKQ
jgi:Tol biopolymer transport system component/predicted Ser/Thr protein kinase